MLLLFACSFVAAYSGIGQVNNKNGVISQNKIDVNDLYHFKKYHEQNEYVLNVSVENEERFNDYVSSEINNNKYIRFGIPIYTEIFLNEAPIISEKNVLSKRIKLIRNNAESIQIFFKGFTISKGDVFSIRNNSEEIILTLDAFSDYHEKYFTPTIQEDTIIIEVISYSENRINTDFCLRKIVFGEKAFSGICSTADCHIDASCLSSYTEETGTIAFIDRGDGTAVTGAVIMNAGFDKIPYILTAFHCIDEDDNCLIQTTDYNYVDDWSFKFFNKTSSCNAMQMDYRYTQITGGADIIAGYRYSDFALIEMNNSIPEDSEIFYAGWKRLNKLPTNATCLNHPCNDLMKATYGIGDRSSDCFESQNGCTNCTTYSNTHWHIRFSNGALQPGSSGSPLYNEDHLIVGQLNGCSAEQGDPCSTSDKECFFGKLSYSWNGGSTSDTRLKDWLDPDNLSYERIETCRFQTNKSFTSNQTITIPYDYVTTVYKNITISNNAAIEIDADGGILFFNNLEVQSGASLIVH